MKWSMNWIAGRPGSAIKTSANVLVPAVAVATLPATGVLPVIAFIGLFAAVVSGTVDVLGNQAKRGVTAAEKLDRDLARIESKIEEVIQILNLIRDIIFSLLFYFAFKMFYSFAIKYSEFFIFIMSVIIAFVIVWLLITALENRKPKVFKN